MNATAITASQMPVPDPNWVLPSRGRVAMSCLIAAEAAIFTIFVVAYLFYVGKDTVGPHPKDVLDAPIFYSICLLSSSLTIHQAVKALRKRQKQKLCSVVAGYDRARRYVSVWNVHRVAPVDLPRWIDDQHQLIRNHLLLSGWAARISRHCRTYILVTVMAFTFLGDVSQEHAARVDVLSLYWHFVDAVWVIVFTVVYVIGR